MFFERQFAIQKSLSILYLKVFQDFCPTLNNKSKHKHLKL